MPDLPQNILSQLVNLPHQPRLAQAYLKPIDMAPDEIPPWSNGVGSSNSAIAFQYWPETVTDSRQSEWNPKNIPGGSHPIYQWTHGGERRISFTTVFTTDTEPPEEALSRDDPYQSMVGGVNVLASGLDLGVRDVDIRSAVSWLRYFTYPAYGKVGDDLRVFEPPKAILTLPNTKLGHDGQDHVICVMTGCEVTYEAWFPSGFPRVVEVQLEFAEVVQQGSQIRFHDRRDMRPSRNLASVDMLHPESGQNGLGGL